MTTPSYLSPFIIADMASIGFLTEKDEYDLLISTRAFAG
jgi:hypothetical protein